MTKSKKKAAPKAAKQAARKEKAKSSKRSRATVSSMAAKKSAASNKAAARKAPQRATKTAAKKAAPKGKAKASGGKKKAAANLNVKASTKKAAANKGSSKKTQGALASLRKLIVDTVAASTSDKTKKASKGEKQAAKAKAAGKPGAAAGLNGAARPGRGRPKLAEGAAGKAPRKGRGRKAASGGVVLTEDAIPMAGPSIDASSDVCREVACDGLSTTGGYCRLHYIKNWRRVKRKEMILKEGKLNQYIEELVAKYPDKYIEAIRHDLANDKDFSKVIYDLDLDETVDEFDVEGEAVESLIDNIKRDFEDEGEF